MLGEGWKHSLLPRKHQIQSEPHAGQRRVVTWSHEANRCLQMASERRYRPSCQPPNLRQGVVCCRMLNFSYDIYREIIRKEGESLEGGIEKTGKRTIIVDFFSRKLKSTSPVEMSLAHLIFSPVLLKMSSKSQVCRFHFPSSSLLASLGTDPTCAALRSRQRALDKNLIW